MRRQQIAETILFSILFLFYRQVLSDSIESMYAFGLLVAAFTVEILSMILLFTPQSLSWSLGFVAVDLLGRIP